MDTQLGRKWVIVNNEKIIAYYTIFKVDEYHIITKNLEK